jgi:hypothetical protein
MKQHTAIQAAFDLDGCTSWAFLYDSLEEKREL